MSNNTKKVKKTKKADKKRIATIIIMTLVCLMFIGIIGGTIALSYSISQKPDVSLSDFESKQSSQIYDKDGELVADVGDVIRTNISYNDLPTTLVDAFVSIEDSRFFEHNGFDIPRFTKALLNNIKTMSFSQGGSTLTMQLVDNTYFMKDANNIGKVEKVSRKFQEIFVSMEVEKIISKERILENYLNMINFGGSGNIRGVEKASEYYFDKNVTELTLSESAMLAGIVNSPFYYDPFNYLDKATQRRDKVLDLMNYHGYITDNELALAKSIKVEDLLVDPSKRKDGSKGVPYQSYIDAVIEEVKEISGYDPINTPMKIYTYLDKDVQNVVDDIQEGSYEGISFPDDLIELAVISMNNKTGEINAIGGGRNYANGGTMLLNHATQQWKQPGSTVKPILSYALAFEHLGWSTSHTVTDRPINYRGTNIIIQNANRKYVGDLTLKDAFGNSLNTPAILTLEEVIDKTSVKYVAEYLQSLGFTKVTKDNFDIGFAIGGSNFEVSVKELNGAMATLINHGAYNVPHTVKKIELIETQEVIEPTYTPTQVLSEEAAYLVTQLMYEAVYGPYHNYMQILKENYPIYAKTGTTNYDSSASAYGIPNGAAKDLWMSGSTSEYSVTMWYGYEKAIKDKNTWISNDKNQANIRGKVVNAVLDANHKGKPDPKPISRPSNIVDITHVLGVYPYTSIIEGMDEQYVAHGLINSKYANLQSPLEAKTEDLKDLKVTVSSKGEIDINFAPYPDISKLQVAEHEKDISLSVGDIYIEAKGNLMFDWSWVYGPIRYKSEIYVNDEKINENMSDQANYKYTIEKLKPGDEIKVIGYYTYEKMPNIQSNQISKDFKVQDSDLTIKVPNEKATKEEIDAWALENELVVEYTEVKDNLLANTNSIAINGSVSNGVELTMLQSEWLKAKIEIILYLPNCGDNATWVDGVCVCKPGFITSPDNNGCIEDKPVDPLPNPDGEDQENKQPDANIPENNKDEEE